MLFEKIQLEPGEAVLVMVRKHWFVICSELFGAVFSMFLPIILIIILTLVPDALSMFRNVVYSNLNIYVLVSTFWILLSLLAAFGIWTHYYLDLWIVTDRRIILIDQIRFFSRNVSIFRLERMQDIEYKIKGLIPTLLNYGTITAQTAGQFESNFRSAGMPDPRGLQATIQTAMDERLRILHIAPDEIAH